MTINFTLEWLMDVLFGFFGLIILAGILAALALRRWRQALFLGLAAVLGVVVAEVLLWLG